MGTISRRAYADLYGPTKGDRVRLADTELLIEIEQDHTIYGEEVTFGGGKVIRDGMGQGQGLAADVADLVITNVIILDYWGIVKADVGIKNGRISGIGKAGNPDIQPGVNIVIGLEQTLLPAKARFSPQVRLTPTSILLRRNRLKKLWRAAPQHW